MKRTQAYRMLAVVIGVMVILTALSSVNSVWGQGTRLQQAPTPTFEPTKSTQETPLQKSIPLPSANLPSSELEETRARQAMEAVLAKYLRYIEPHAPIEVVVEGEWAYGVAKWQSQIRMFSNPTHILAHRLPNGTWQALLPDGDGLYKQWLDEMPEKLISVGEKGRLREQTVQVSTQNWTPFTSKEFGYTIQYPSHYNVQERQTRQTDKYSGVPSDVWFSSEIHVISRIPPLPNDVIERIWGAANQVTLKQGTKGLRIERTSQPIGGGEISTAIEYLIRSDGVDYFLIYNPAESDSLDEQQTQQIFEQMVASFEVLQDRAYTAPDDNLRTASADGFDFFVAPTEGGTGEPERYVSFNVKNPNLNWTSPCYDKPMSSLQHAGEDWFRNVGSNVYAVANGRVVHAKDANYPGAVVIIEHELDNGWTTPWGGNIIYSVYSHLSTNDLVSERSDVTRGQVIGKVVWQANDNYHVHFEMRRYGDMTSILICPSGEKSSWPGPGYTDENVHPNIYGYIHPSNWINSHRPDGGGTPCPTPCGDIGGLVKDSNSGTPVSGAEVKFVSGGFILNNTTNGNGSYLFSNVPAGDVVIEASKPEIGSGSVNVTVLPYASTQAPDIFLFPMCSTRTANRSILDCVPNNPPNTPSPKNPHDWYVSRDGRAPTLCWNNNGDPDGNSVEFYAEVYDSAVNANSGWQSGDCWRPGSLDGRYYNYKWRVKARDSHGAESGWSDTWHFNIEEPNAPPTISFDTANGNNSSRIESRDRNWTFQGTANDPEGQLSQIEFRCSGDNCGDYNSHSGLSNWTYERHNIAGQNDVYFVAHDDRQSAASRHLDLRVDLSAPTTTPSLNNDANPDNWPEWFTAPVQVRLNAADGNTGRARSRVKEIHYRLDGGAWQTQGGSTVAFTAGSDGSRTVEFYAVDNVGNQEGTRSVSFQIDQAPPDPPSGVTETHGVVNDQWQNAENIPAFIWAAAGDATSGLWGYQFYFGVDPNGVGYQTFLAADPRQWTPLPGGTRTDTYYLRGRTRDNAGNWSDWITLFTFRYDGAPPENPAQVTHTLPITNDTWQNLTNQPDFIWPIPHDEGSGIQGYYLYWGGDPEGESADFITVLQYQSSTALCGANEACTAYLRLRSVDNVDNPAEDWSTAFTLRYDNAPPTADFTFSGGVTQTNQTLVTLVISATDQGSGLYEMRLSNDGQTWAPWEVFAMERLWSIPGVSRQSWPVYLQVRDGVGLASDVVSHTIYLDVNPAQPRSANFRLFDRMLNAGAGAYTSTTFSGRGTIGQVIDSANITSANYILFGGYEAGSQAIPIVDPGHDEFTFINGVFAPGSGAVTLTSTLYAMQGTLGEVGLPNNETTLASASYQHQPGFLAAAPPAPQVAPTPTPTPGPTPTPTPAPACEFPQISINNGDLFTNNAQVTLDVCAPYVEEMMISNDGGFGGAQWEPYAESKLWTITTYGQHVLPRFVYAVFKDADGVVYGIYMDDVIYDPTPPSGNVSVGDSVSPEVALRSMVKRGDTSDASFVIGSQRYVRRVGDTILERPMALASSRADGSVDLYLNAMDDNSGVAEMQISASSQFTDITWEPFSALKPWTPTGGDGVKTVYVRVRDDANNASELITSTFYLDTLPPIGGIYIADRVAGPDSITATVYLGAEDNLTGVSDMRLSADPAFLNVAWIPYTYTLTWPISFTNQAEESLYVQYRDLAGNISEVYSDTYLLDTAPPIVYVEVGPGDALTRTVAILAYDGLIGASAGAATMYLSNDPLMIADVVTLPYTPTVGWIFDERRVIWAQVEDRVGNVSEPYPAFAGYGAVEAGFTASPLAGQAPLTVVFTGTSGGEITNWLWNFGDGITSTVQSPTHTYTLTGAFTVSLAVGSPGDSDILTKTDYIRVSDNPVIANFTASPASGEAPLIVHFSDASAGDITAWQWDFGNGIFSTLQNPTYVYPAAGVYTVSLMVSGPEGSDQLTRPGYISVTQASVPPVADFTAAPLAGQPPLTVVFTDTSAGDITSWQWNFGDENSTLILPPSSLTVTHTYLRTGAFTVSLTVAGPGGSDVEVKTRYIKVSDDPVIANFTAGPTSGSAPLAVQFTDASIGDVAAWQWAFGDGEGSNRQHPSHIYASGGVYTVTLAISGPEGNDSETKMAYISVVEYSVYLPLILKNQ